MKKRLLATLLCVMMVLTLLPATATAAEATVNYLDITTDGDGNPTGCDYSSTDTDTEGILIENGTYAFSDAYARFVVVNNATVTYSADVDLSRFGSNIYIFGTGSFAANNLMVTKGSYDTAYEGNTGEALLTFIVGLRDGDTDYSYTLKDNVTLNNFLTVYDLTINAEKTLTISAPPTSVDDTDPDHYRLTVVHSLTADGTLDADEGQELEIRENAAVSGIVLYDTDGTSTYTLAANHATEFFTFTGGKWVRQGGSGEGGGEGQTAPTVSFCVQNTATAAGTAQYKINDGAWTDVTLTPEGEPEHQHLAGTVSGTMETNNVIHIKATPGANYVMDTVRGVNVNGTAIPNGAASIVSTDGLSYTLSENKNYEFEFGFSESGGGGGSDPGPGPGTPEHTIIASAGSNGSITPSGAQTVNEGQNRQFTFRPENGYEVDVVLVDDNPVSVTAPEYEFQNVTADHTISVSFKQITGAVGDAATAKEKIEGRRWGYGGADAAAIKTAFAAELWNMAVHEFSGVFADSAAVAAAVTLSTDTYTTSSEFYRADEALCPYYTFTVELGENDASGKVYVLANTTDYVVVINGGPTAGNFAVVSGQECVVNKNYDTIGVFGNGAAIEGQLGSGENYVAFHVATRAGLGADTFRLTVYKTSFVGSTVAVSDNYKAAAWGFAQAKIAEFGSSAADPAEFEVFFGNGSVTLSAANLSNIGIQALVDVTAPSLPDGAVKITGNGGDSNAKTFTIDFNSNFYDEVPLTITYTDKTGGNSTAYLMLKRVGIDIQAYQKAGDSNGLYNTNHGTDPGLQDRSWGDDNYAVYASYYYPTDFDNNQNTYVEPSTSVQLYATYTWANGSVTREIITGAAPTEGNENSVPIDDFLLYKGTESGAPAKIEVTAVNTGGTGAVFAGATLGSGAGVEWRYVHREPPMQPPVD